MSMLRKKPKTPGWAAFDLKQRNGNQLLPNNQQDPYPPIKTALGSSHQRVDLARNEITNNNINNSLGVSYSAVLQQSEGRDDTSKKLKDLHPWADDGLVKDILSDVNNDFVQASCLLDAMASNDSRKEDKDRIGTGSDIAMNKLLVNDASSADKWVSLGNSADVGKYGKHSSSVDKAATRLNEEFREKLVALENSISDDTAQMEHLLERLKNLPIEPEWEEEEDLYSVHRRDALRKMRSASQHSKAATNAFLRGDHLSARKHSLRAREEWSAAKRLNDKAAREILNIRNSRNDLWKLDLHGLHATEAITALRHRLQEIESLDTFTCSVSPKIADVLVPKNEVAYSSSEESLISTPLMENLDKPYSSRQKLSSLEVITGVGNHSRGEAALPVAVRNFLAENEYCFDEIRPGMITVRPKFRRG